MRQMFMKKSMKIHEITIVHEQNIHELIDHSSSVHEQIMNSFHEQFMNPCS